MKNVDMRCFGTSLLGIWAAGFPVNPATSSMAGEETGPLTLKLQLEESRPLHQDCYGANLQLHHGPIWFNHPDLIQKYIGAGTPFFRFPGGTSSNFYNPRTGLMNEEAPSNHDYEALNRKIVQKTDGVGDTPAGFFEFAETTGARYSVVLNVCTRSLEQNREWLKGLAEQGITIPCFEIGNELYFGLYDWAFARPEDYLERARQSTGMIRDIFPKAKIGVVVPSHIYTFEVFLEGRQPHLPRRQQRWLELLEDERFFDAAVVHLYSRVGMDNDVKEEEFLSFEDSYSHAVDYAERHLDKALDLLESKFPGSEIWITEYGLGGFGGALGKYGLRHSHLGCLHSDLMLLRFLSRDSITVSSWHSFTQCIAYDRQRGGIRDEPTCQFQHLTLFADPMRNSEFYVPVQTDAGDSVEAGAFIGNERGYAIILNKRSESFVLGGIKSANGTRLVGAVQLSPGKGLPLVGALESNTSIEKTVMDGDGLKQVAFPGYSITRLEFVGDHPGDLRGPSVR